jgi:hypothetical protein
VLYVIFVNLLRNYNEIITKLLGFEMKLKVIVLSSFMCVSIYAQEPKFAKTGLGDDGVSAAISAVVPEEVSRPLGFFAAFTQSFQKDGDLKTAIGMGIGFLIREALKDEAKKEMMKHVASLKSKLSSQPEEKKEKLLAK